jgi:hypothetical protein
MELPQSNRDWMRGDLSMTTPAKYREYADAIWAASSSEVRAVLLSMAKRWTELAERAERDAHLGAPAEAFEEKKPAAPSRSRQSRRARKAGSG